MRFFKPFGSVKAMTFDLDDTLYNNGPVIRQAEQTLKSHLDKHFPRAARLTVGEWQSIKQDLISEIPELRSDMGELRLRTLKRALVHDGLTDDALHNAAMQCFNCFYDARSNLTLDDDIHRVMAELSERIPLIAITNGNVDVEKVGIAGYFKRVYHASISRPMKPDVHMFDEAVNVLNMQPHNILHVGDSLINDVYGAGCAGMNTAWFAANRNMQLSAERASALPHVMLETFDELLAFAHR